MSTSGFGMVTVKLNGIEYGTKGPVELRVDGAPGGTHEQYQTFVKLMPTVAKLTDPDEVSLPALQAFFRHADGGYDGALLDVVDAASMASTETV